ncbi:MAG: addiction module protein [Bacteroidota bacterium]
MTFNQQEQHILKLLHQLPLVRRIQLAWTVLQGVQPDQIDVLEQKNDIPPFSPVTDQEWKAMINSRASELETGKVSGVDLEEVMRKADNIAP